MPTEVNLASSLSTVSLSTTATARPVAPASTLAPPGAPVDRMTDEGFWRETFPELSMGNLFSGNFEINALGAERDQRVADRMRIEGYFQESDEALVDLSQRLSIAIERAYPWASRRSSSGCSTSHGQPSIASTKPSPHCSGRPIESCRTSGPGGWTPRPARPAGGLTATRATSRYGRMARPRP